MCDQVFREEQHGRVGLEDGRLHGLVRVVFRREIGIALPHAPIVCIDRFPSCRELRLRVLEVKDKTEKRQTDDAVCWLEAQAAQKDDYEGQAEPFRAGEKNACGKKGRSPSDDPERRDRGEKDAKWHRKSGFASPAREQQTPGQRQ